MIRPFVTILLLLCPLFSLQEPAQAQIDLTPVEARAIAKEAYIYGFPLVDNYRVQHSYFVDRGGPEFRAVWNTIFNNARVYTPEDKSIQTPNSDTPYSYVGADLRAEPLLLTVPAIEKDRYYSLQFIDWNTYNFAYVGSRTTGNGAGRYLLAGPGWKGEKPAGVDAVIRSDTDFAFVLYRTQLFSSADIDNVKAIQAGYKVEPLSKFLGAPPPKAPAVDFAPPLSRNGELTSPEFFNILNFVLQFAPADPSEAALREHFAKLGIMPGKPFEANALPAPILDAVKQGMADAWAEFNAFKATEIDTGKVTSADLFGTRTYLKNNYLYRMAGAVLGIYGNSKEEAIYPAYPVDANGAPLDGAKHAYAFRFAPGKLPPVDAFWSLTMYEMPESLLYANPINRYLINSPLLPSLARDADGGITLYTQHDSPGADKETNWLPAPSGPFAVILRLYWPKQEAFDGSWKRPPLEPIDLKTAPPKEGLITVTPETYIRAETDRSFGNIQAAAGGVNRFFQSRKPTPLDSQTVIRMNRDTLYSGAIVDTSKGATITLPKAPDGRLVSALVVDNDHYAPAVFYEPGTHKIASDTKYVLVAVRIQLFDPNDSKEVALVNALQDEVEIEAGSADPFIAPNWDQESLKVLTAQYEKEAASYSSWKGMMGPRGVEGVVWRQGEQTRRDARLEFSHARLPPRPEHP